MAWGKTAFMSRCSSAQRPVASAWREKCKQVVSGVCNDDVTCPFILSGVVQVLKAGQVHTNDPFCCPNSPLQSSYIWFAGWPKPDRYRGAQNRLNNSRVKLSYARLNFLSWRRKYSLCTQCDCLNVIVPLQVLGDGGYPLQSQCYSWW